MDNNPYLEPEDYFKDYAKSMQEMHDNPEIVQFDKLCFHVFDASEDGKKLVQQFKDRFIYPSTPCQLNGHYDKAAIYYEGFREAFRLLISSVQNYKNRMEAEAKTAIQQKVEESNNEPV